MSSRVVSRMFFRNLKQENFSNKIFEFKNEEISSFFIHGIKTSDNKISITGDITYNCPENGTRAVKRWESDNIKDIIEKMEEFLK